jgi:hypothetical protein
MQIVDDQVPEPFDAFASMQALWEGSVNPSTGTFTGDYHQNPPLLEVTYDMKGQFALNATPGGAAGSGTYWKSEPPGYPHRSRYLEVREAFNRRKYPTENLADRTHPHGR